MFSLSFIDFVDALSPLVTLGFGIYCAVNDTKPKDGKLSRSGKIALWGMIISGLITVMVKLSDLNTKYEDGIAKLEKEREENREKDSINKVNSAFQKATIDSLSRSIDELDNIKSASVSTLTSLDKVTTKQQSTLENTRRGLNPLFPMKFSMSYTIDLKEYFKQDPWKSSEEEIYKYLDTLVYYASIIDYKQKHRRAHQHEDSIIIPKGIPKVHLIYPFDNYNLSNRTLESFKAAKNRFAHMFLTIKFRINLRRNNKEETGIKNQLVLRFDLFNLYRELFSGAENSNFTVDMKKKIVYVSVLTENPEILTSENTTDFISIYDLQNSVLGFSNGFKNEVNYFKDPAVFKLQEITIYTGYDFSRMTSLKFLSNDTKYVCCDETYARKIRTEEIK